MHAGDRKFDRHSDVLLGDLRRRARSTIAAIDLQNVRAGIVGAHCHHVDIGRRRNFHRDKRLGINGLDPIDVLLMVLDGINAVKWKRREQTDPRHRLAHGGYCRSGFVAEQVTAQSGLSSLRILKLDDRRILNRLLSDAEHAGSNLSDDVICIRNKHFWVSPFAG